MNNNLLNKNPQSAGNAAGVQPGRTDAEFDAAKYTPAPIQPVRVPNVRLTPPAVAPATGSPNAGIQAINESVRSTSGWVQPLRQQMARVIVGQEQLVDRLMVGLHQQRPHPSRRRAGTGQDARR